MAWDKNKYYREYYKNHPEYRKYQQDYHKRWFAEHPGYTQERYYARLKRLLKGEADGQTQA